jgi:alkylhydroperoxidase family enzyme
MRSRIAPAEPPYAPWAQAAFDRVMPPGAEPLLLFRVLARDRRLFERFMGGGLLDRGHLSLRDRELVIDRVTAHNGSEYEWGIHIAFFADRIGLTDEQRRAIVDAPADADCWVPRERLLLRLVDAIDGTTRVDDRLWHEAVAAFGELACLEIILLCGFYRTVSLITNTLEIPGEPGAARFPKALHAADTFA